MMKVFRYLWFFLRYLLATVSSIIVTVVIPLVIASLPFLFALFWVLLWAFALLFSLLPGQSMDLPMEEPMGIVLIPMLLSIVSAVSASIALVATSVFNFIVILPVGIFIEYFNKRLGLRSWIIRIGSHLVGGFLLGLIVGIIGIILANKLSAGFSLLEQIGIGALLAVICIGGEFIFGISLAILDLIRKFVEFLNGKARNTQERKRLSTTS